MTIKRLTEEKKIYLRLNTFFNQDCEIKFKLINIPEYQIEGKIIYLCSEYVLINLKDTKTLMQFNPEEINYHTIFPLEYNPLKYPKRGFISSELREHIFSRDNYQCQIKSEGCTNKAEEIDHIIPVSKGGTEHPDNLQASCLNCNRKKSDKV